MKEEILQIEELSINAFPAILTELYDGWILRYSNGYTYRGNSINPLYPSTIDLENKIDYCEDKYFKKGLPCIYKMTENVAEGLDSCLEKCGYTIEKSADIMVCEIDKSTVSQLQNVNISMDMTNKWLEGFLNLNEIIEESIKATVKTMLSNIQNPVICINVNEGDTMIACGLGVLENRKIGLYDIIVMEQYRCKGLGRKICKAIIDQGVKNDAYMAYLQVTSSNEQAVRLYNSLGFKKLYTYWYRVKKVI
ncbi:GNAT family N-acetyltransferase [Clostridium saccharoperbutylacetonicum]|uniref:GNAT family N-acetyltransferase n=1 Tax=Clostridium saccharoperbutylacetonicum TaxID=36745 RepID=UPI0039EAE826